MPLSCLLPLFSAERRPRQDSAPAFASLGLQCHEQHRHELGVQSAPEPEWCTVRRCEYLRLGGAETKWPRQGGGLGEGLNPWAWVTAWPEDPGRQRCAWELDSGGGESTLGLPRWQADGNVVITHQTVKCI